MANEDPYQLKHYLNSINHEKVNLMDGDDGFWEKKYPSYIINKAMAAHSDCIYYANEMNKMHHLDNKLKNDFFINSIRPKKRWSSWLRSSKIKNLEYVKEYYGYSNEKAKQALKILNNDQLEEIKKIINRGGLHGRN